MMGTFYMLGRNGVTQNPNKAEKFFKRSYDLGDPVAADLLYQLHDEHIITDDAHEHIHDEARMIQYVEEGVRRGNYRCTTILAHRAHQSGNPEEATRQYMTAARSGDDIAMNKLVEYYRTTQLSKEDLATTLRAKKVANDKVRNAPRECAKRFDYLRETMEIDRELNAGIVPIEYTNRYDYLWRKNRDQQGIK